MADQKALIRNSLDTGHPEQALRSLRAMLREFPDNASLYNLMGLTQLALKNPSRAVRAFQTAYKLDQQPSSALNLSSAYIASGDIGRALRLLNGLLKETAKNHYQYKERIYHNLGYAYVRQRRWTTAEHWFHEALDENPTFFPSHLELARLYESTHRPAMAVKEFRRSMDFCHVCFEPVQALTSLYMKLGHQTDARRMLIQYGRMDGVAAADKTKATQLLRLVTTSDLKRRKG